MTVESTLDQSMADLARLLFIDQEPYETLAATARLAAQAIAGCEAASVTVAVEGRFATAASSAELALVLDERQYAHDDGPCLEALRTGRLIRVDSFGAETRWPAFTAAAVERGIRSSLSLPLAANGEVVGALNLYSTHEDEFVGAEEAAELFSHQAAVTLANASAFHQARVLAQNLELALAHRDVIGQAKGILMATEHMSAEQAFEVLRRASQRTNRKVYDLAREIVERRSGTDKLS